MAEDPDLTHRLAFYPLDWLSSRNGRNPHRIYVPQFSMKTHLFFKMDWDENTPIASHSPIRPVDAVAEQRKFLGNTSLDMSDCQKAWSLHAAAEMRVMELATERNKLEIIAKEISRNISNLLAPLWNWNQELMVLYARFKVLGDTFFQKYLTSAWKAELHQAQSNLAIIKTQNLIYSNLKPQENDVLPREIAICVNMFESITALTNDIGVKRIVVSQMNGPSTQSYRIFSHLIEKEDIHSMLNMGFNDNEIVGYRTQVNEITTQSLTDQPNLYIMPSDWLPHSPLVQRKHYVTSMLSKRYCYSFISLDAELPHQSEALSSEKLNVSQSEMIETLQTKHLGTSQDEQATVNDLVEDIWALHAETEKRLIDLQVELRQLQLYSPQKTQHLLLPIWSFYQEVMDLFANIWKISLVPLPLPKSLVCALNGVKKSLQFIKTKNFAQAKGKHELDTHVPSCIAECIMLCDECTSLLGVFDTKVLTTSSRAIVHVFEQTGTLDGLIGYLGQVRNAQEKQFEVTLSDLERCNYKVCQVEQKSLKYLQDRESQFLFAGGGSALVDETVQKAYDALNECLGIIEK